MIRLDEFLPEAKTTQNKDTGATDKRLSLLFPLYVLIIAIQISMIAYERGRINRLEQEVELLKGDIEELFERDKDLRSI